jgi:hypothetical protein
MPEYYFGVVHAKYPSMSLSSTDVDASTGNASDFCSRAFDSNLDLDTDYTD